MQTGNWDDYRFILAVVELGSLPFSMYEKTLCEFQGMTKTYFNDGETMLHCALRQNHYAKCELLLDVYSADVFAKTRYRLMTSIAKNGFVDESIKSVLTRLGCTEFEQKLMNVDTVRVRRPLLAKNRCKGRCKRFKQFAGACAGLIGVLVILLAIEIVSVGTIA